MNWSSLKGLASCLVSHPQPAFFLTGNDQQTVKGPPSLLDDMFMLEDTLLIHDHPYGVEGQGVVA